MQKNFEILVQNGMKIQSGAYEVAQGQRSGLKGCCNKTCPEENLVHKNSLCFRHQQRQKLV